MTLSMKDKIFQEQLEGIRGMCQAVIEGAYPVGTPEYNVCVMLENALHAFWLHKGIEEANK